MPTISRRIERLEHRGSGLQEILIMGGVTPEPTTAAAGAWTWDRESEESLAAFTGRVRELVAAVGATVVVVGGLPALARK